MDSPFWEDNRKTEEENRYLEALILSFTHEIKDQDLKKKYMKHFNITQHTHGKTTKTQTSS
jgi:hypothetical protein